MELRRRIHRIECNFRSKAGFKAMTNVTDRSDARHKRREGWQDKLCICLL